MMKVIVLLIFAVFYFGFLSVKTTFFCDVFQSSDRSQVTNSKGSLDLPIDLIKISRGSNIVAFGPDGKLYVPIESLYDTVLFKGNQSRAFRIVDDRLVFQPYATD